MASIFILLTVSFAEQKLLIFMKSTVSNLFFIDCAFGVVSKKSLPNSRSSTFLPCNLIKVLLFWIYIGLLLIFRGFFLCVWKVQDLCLGLFFKHVDVQLFKHHWLKRLSLLHCTAFAPSSKISWLYLCGSIPLIYLPILSPIPHCFDYRSYIVGLEVE